jgi:hypothetical protein
VFDSGRVVPSNRPFRGRLKEEDPDYPMFRANIQTPAARGGAGSWGNPSRSIPSSPFPHVGESVPGRVGSNPV